MRNLVPRSLTVVLMLLALVACSTDTPTAPERTPAPPPGSGPTTAWNIRVTVEPRNLTANDAQPATVTIQVRRASDGVAPAPGTTVVVSASLGLTYPLADNRVLYMDAAYYQPSGDTDRFAFLPLSVGISWRF